MCETLCASDESATNGNKMFLVWAYPTSAKRALRLDDSTPGPIARCETCGGLGCLDCLDTGYDLVRCDGCSSAVAVEQDRWDEHLCAECLARGEG